MAATILLSVTMTLQGPLPPALRQTKRKPVNVMPAEVLEVVALWGLPFLAAESLSATT